MRVAGLILIFAGILGGWWFVSRRTGAPGPREIIQARPIPIKDTVDVEAGHSVKYTFTVPAGKAPGLLQGHWSAQGKSANIKGATDDTLVGFTLRGPDNNVIQSLDHPTSGNFSSRCGAAGAYTFEFSNAGIIRSSSRRVTIDGSYQPD